MGYTTEEGMVRVDFFKPSGKWYETEAMKWDEYFSKDRQGKIHLIHDIFLKCLYQQFQNQYDGMWAVCLHPYHEHAHPLMVFKRGQ